MRGRDEELRRRFHALRDADRAAAPPFDALASRTRVARVHARRRWVLAGAGLTAAAAGVALYVAAARRADAAERWAAAGAAIARWQAPTDTLLRFHGRELLAAPPALGASVLDTILPLPRPTPRGD